MQYTSNQLHAHTEASLFDGAQTVEGYVNKAKALGAKALAITDHGLCANWLEFYNCCKANEIKPILGVEAYVTTEGYFSDIPFDNTPFINKEIRQHLILLAKDYQGMQAISRFVSEANRNIDSMGKPVGKIEDLAKFFGPESKGFGHVVATSACIAGPIATAAAYNLKIQREITKLENKNDKIKSGFEPGVLEAKKFVDKTNLEIDKLQQEVDSLKIKASKTFKESREIIKSEEDPEKKALLKESLMVEQAETKLAKEKTKELKAKIKDIKSDEEYKSAKKLYNSIKKKLQGLSENEDKIKVLNSKLCSNEELLAKATNVANIYENIFGSNNFFAEIQYHGIEDEKFLYPLVAKAAKAAKLKLVATNDIHITEKEDALKRQLLQNCEHIGGNWREQNVGDDELYFKSGDEIAEMLLQIFPQDIVDEAMSNIDVICDMCNLTLSEEKHYPEFENADEKLRQMAEKNIPERYPNGFPKEYQERMDYELGIISKMGYSSYFLFIADVIENAKNSRENTLEIGPGRGSGAGSIVCYLTKITELDPMEYGLLFERFLNPSRVSMPKQYWAFNVNSITQRCA